MKTKIVYQNEEFRLPAVIDNTDTPLFLASEVCKSLELDNVSAALRGLDEDEKAKVIISNVSYDPNINGSRKKLRVSAITESGFYTLAFKSRKPAAKRFRKWVTSEILPQIRKYGSYTLDRDNLKPGYKEIASNVFGIMGSKSSGIKATQVVANQINKAVVGMTAEECKEKYKVSPRDYILKALRVSQSSNNKLKEKEYEKLLHEYDSVQHLVNHFLENGGHPLEVKRLLKDMKY